MKKVLYLIFSLFLSFGILRSEEKVPEVGIVEKLGNQLPLELTFTNTEGQKFQLKDVITKPTVLSFVYYHCPGICSPLLGGLVDLVDKSDLVPGVDYQLITIGFDHRETYDKAKKWKEQHLKLLEKQINPNAWIFTVGDSLSIRKATNAAGFYFKFDGKNDYIHAASIFILTPSGKISNYMFGTEFNPMNLKTAIMEAKKEGQLPTIAKILSFCYSYDVKSRRYVLNLTSVIGIVMLLSAGIFLTVLIAKKKNKEKKGEVNE
jgi:protein SCO1/2